MKKIFLCVVVLLCSFCSYAFAQLEIRVDNATDFVHKLGSDRIIRLEPGTYDLSRVQCSALGRAYRDEFRGITLKNVQNLTIIGEGDKPVSIVTPNVEETVLTFSECKNLALRNLKIGHTIQPRGCEGDALALLGVQGAKLDRMDLYGCGQFCLVMSRSGDIVVDNSYIHDCTYSLLEMESVGTVRFNKTRFVHDGALEAFYVGYSDAKTPLELSFKGCDILVDRQRNVFSPLPKEKTEYAAKHSLFGIYYQNLLFHRFHRSARINTSFEKCQFRGVDPLEMKLLQENGVNFKDSKLKINEQKFDGKK